MKKLLLISTVFIMIFVVSCKEEKKTEGTLENETEKVVEEKKEEPKHWSYDGESSPDHWKEIEKESSCDGNLQSPIDIFTSNVEEQFSGLRASDIHYNESTTIHDVVNNGHSIQYNFDKEDNYLNYKEKRYNLAQFHFHAASEHTINGMHYPLVIHMVHVSEDKEFVVFAIMVTEGEENDNFSFIEEYLPVMPGEKKVIDKARSFSNYILEDFDHYYYQGSLTTPPCTETVNWFVFKNIISASPTQIKILADLMPRNNFRPTQPLNDRKVYLSE